MARNDTNILPALNSPNVTVRQHKRSAPFGSDRAYNRMIKQRIVEVQQEAEERDAFKSHPEHMRMLRETFASVKTEFLPLDGQSWDTPAGRREIDLHARRLALRRSNHLSPARAGSSRLARRSSRSSLRTRGYPIMSQETSEDTATQPVDMPCDDTNPNRPTTPLPLDVDDRELSRTPIPTSFKTGVDLDSEWEDEDITFCAELETPKALPAEDRKFTSTVGTPRSKLPYSSPQKSPSKLPRLMRQVPGVGVALPLDGNTSSKPQSSGVLVAHAHVPPALSVPESPSCVSSKEDRKTSTGSPTKASLKSRKVLASSKTYNRDSISVNPSPTGVARPTLSSAKRAVVSTKATVKGPIKASVPRNGKQTRTAKAPIAASDPVFFPRTEEPAERTESSSIHSSSIPPRSRVDTVKASVQKTTSGQSHAPRIRAN